MKKHILCFGDSNTHGYCADPCDCADGGARFNEDERWTCLLGKALGDEYLIIEEGLGGRTTVFEDPYTEGLSGLSYIYPCMKSHDPISLLIIMLGTNDTKERFNANPTCISMALERLIKKAKTVNAWANKPNILIVAPPHIHPEHSDAAMGPGCSEKSRALAFLYRAVCERQDCAFLDAEGIAEFNQIDHMHLTKNGHTALAKKLSEIVPELV